MWIETPILKEDMEQICESNFIPWNKLKKKTVLVTGATGLIGSTLVNALLYVNIIRKLELKVFALVRDITKANKVFEKQLEECKELTLICCDIQNTLDISEKIDYIVHGANPTASSFFMNFPVETAKIALMGTMNVLDLAYRKKVESVVFLSTMEVYGYPKKGHKVTEEEIGAFQVTNVRNSYPISKQMCENLCCSYYEEYNVPVKVLRLTQTFGPGMMHDDKRIFAEFARSVLENKAIVLKTKGETERSYLYTADAVTAILSVLLNGVEGQIYTAANENTYYSIYEMAQMVAKEYGIDVVVEDNSIKHLGYADTLYMNLDTGKLRELGWKAQINLMDMYKRMIEVCKV